MEVSSLGSSNASSPIPSSWTTAPSSPSPSKYWQSLHPGPWNAHHKSEGNRPPCALFKVLLKNVSCDHGCICWPHALSQWLGLWIKTTIRAPTFGEKRVWRHSATYRIAGLILLVIGIVVLVIIYWRHCRDCNNERGSSPDVEIQETGLYIRNYKNYKCVLHRHPSGNMPHPQHTITSIFCISG